MHGAFQSAMGGLAAQKSAARSHAAYWYRQGASDGRRRKIDNTSNSATHRHRGRSQQRLRRYHLQKGPVVFANAGEFSWRRYFPRGNSSVYRQAQIFELHDRRLVECAFGSFEETSRENRGRLDAATGVSGREGQARKRRQGLADAGALQDRKS